MDWEEPRQKPVAIVVGEPLHQLSQAELEARIAALKVEIARVEEELQVKRNRSAAAAALFKD